MTDAVMRAYRSTGRNGTCAAGNKRIRREGIDGRRGRSIRAMSERTGGMCWEVRLNSIEGERIGGHYGDRSVNKNATLDGDGQVSLSIGRIPAS